MKVIFLDIDGVLNSDEYFDRIQGLDIQGIETQVDINKIRLLKNAVIDTGAKVVLSSSWRNTRMGQELRNLLLSYGIFADVTPHIDNKRGNEIKEWLSNHEDIEDFVILDDEIFDTFDEELLEKLIKISDGNGKNFGEGLQEKDMEKIIERLGRRKNKEHEDEER